MSAGMDEEGLREVCRKLKIDVPPTIGKGKLIDELFGNTSEHAYVQPTFIIDYPVEMSPLTKKHHRVEERVGGAFRVNGKWERDRQCL